MSRLEQLRRPDRLYAERGRAAVPPPATYEAPQLTPIGNLNDLLAGGGSNCDDEIQTGTIEPKGAC
jgi:hypothetical protein